MTPSETPILLLVFNRPDKVRQLISALALVKPKKLYVSSDGPRVGVVADVQKCQETRALFLELPWECEVMTNFSDRNLGCMSGPVSGINWFFSHVEEGIILEDDCIPSPAFFPYITELLNQYRHDEQIMHLSGTSFLTGMNIAINERYYFSHIAHGWGWATWKRAWNKFDIKMSELEGLPKKLEDNNTFISKRQRRFWVNLFKHVQTADNGIWDAQWEYSILNNQGICITPAVSLIENIGFDADATHTKAPSGQLLGRKFKTAELPSTLPSIKVVNKAFDKLETDAVFVPSLADRVSSFFKKCYYLLTFK
jgi:hypothetical protein